MAKNITIREGDTSKQFTAKKLKTNLVGGGTTNWVPEDEAIDYVKLVDKEFKANGTYSPEDFNADGFGQVKVNIPAEVKPKTITENGEFYAADDGVVGYSKVTVAVPSGGGGGPYTVRFFDDDRQTIIKTDATVPYGGSASCTDLDGTVLNGLYFKGWNPTPVNVKEDMNCYPERGEYQISAGEIEDSWETICALKGAGYPIGSFKTLHFTVPAYTYDMTLPKKDGTSEQKTVNVSAKEILMHMVKVAEGEDGSTSTWLSNNAFKLPFPNTSILRMDLGMYPYQTSVYGNYGSYINRDWDNCEVRKYLQGKFFEAMPQSLRDTIKPVTKYYKGVTSYTDNYPNKAYKSCIDTIWVPSTKECSTMIGQESVTAWSYPSECEPSGIDYTAVYTPTFRPDGDTESYVYMVTRTIASNGYPIRRTNKSNWRADINGTSNIANGVAFGFCL